MNFELDIVIPVFNERENITRVLDSLRKHVKTRFRVLICYDRDDDNTLIALDAYRGEGLSIVRVKNRGKGPLGAVLTGFAESRAPAVLVFPADDDYNAPRIDTLMALFRSGCEIVTPSRFVSGGCMKGCPFIKAVLVRSSAFVLHHFARLPSHDPSNGLRLFSRRVLERIPIESSEGFTYSIELLVKAHRLGWKIGESPVSWFERKQGTSRFLVLKWLPQYFRWFRYAFRTTLFRRGPETVRLRPEIPKAS